MHEINMLWFSETDQWLWIIPPTNSNEKITLTADFLTKVLVDSTQSSWVPVTCQTARPEKFQILSAISKALPRSAGISRYSNGSGAGSPQTARCPPRNRSEHFACWQGIVSQLAFPSQASCSWNGNALGRWRFQPGQRREAAPHAFRVLAQKAQAFFFLTVNQKGQAKQDTLGMGKRNPSFTGNGITAQEREKIPYRCLEL